MTQGRVGVSRVMTIGATSGATGSTSLARAIGTATQTIPADTFDHRLDFADLIVYTNPGSVIDIANDRVLFPSTGTWQIALVLDIPGPDYAGGGSVEVFANSNTGQRDEIFQQYAPANDGMVIPCVVGPRKFLGGQTLNFSVMVISGAQCGARIWTLSVMRLA